MLENSRVVDLKLVSAESKNVGLLAERIGRNISDKVQDVSRLKEHVYLYSSMMKTSYSLTIG